MISRKDASQQSCGCDNSDGALLCSVCVRNALRGVQARHSAALVEWKSARNECEAHFLSPEAQSRCSLLELQDRSQRLREELDRLRKQCSEEALRVCASQIRIEERQMQQREQALVAIHREKLHQLEATICDTKSGALSHAIQTTADRVRKLRFQWAMQVFELHRLQAERPQQEVPNERRKSHRNFVSGTGKIGGLPLPHAGPELFGVLPAEELQSALRLVASLTTLVSRCLAILLPHPILLRPGDEEVGDIVNDYSEHEKTVVPLANEPAGGAFFQYTAPSMDPVKVQQRIRLATSAILVEARGSMTKYVLSADKIHQDEFAIALQLLQNNVIALCIRSGVPVAKLWPGEAVLLNLQALKEYCGTQVGTE